MAYQVTVQNFDQIFKQSDHKNQPLSALLQQDLRHFISKNGACACTLVQLNVDNKGKKNVFMIRGKLGIKVPQTGRDKLLGFKFVLPFNYPQAAPLVFLDEPENEEIINMVDYMDKGNRINFEYSLKWAQLGMNVQHQVKEYNLMNLLMRVYQLFVKMPPLSIAELFGVEPEMNNNPQNSAPQGEEWEDIPPELLLKQNSIMLEKHMSNQEKELEADLDNFDPFSELHKYQQDQPNGISSSNRQSIWKQNFKMQNEMKQKAEKANIINHLVPQIIEICVGNIGDAKKESVQACINQMDDLQEQQKMLKKQEKQVNKMNEQLKETIPQMDEQIELLKKQLEEMSAVEVNSEFIQKDLLQPTDNLAAKILKCDIKDRAFQDTVFGLKTDQELSVPDIQLRLKQIRKVSNKQFKQVFNKQRLQTHQRQLNPEPQANVGGYPQ